MSPETSAAQAEAGYDKYQSPLAERNASEEMVRIWSPRRKFSTWRRLWTALAESEREMGLTQISAEAIDQMRANVDNIDFESAKRHEKKTRHDVMAHVLTFEEAAPAAKGIIHLGATSMDINDNGDLLIMRDAIDLVIAQLANLVDAQATFAEQQKNQATVGFTHLQAGQPTTVGKRAALWCQDSLIALQELQRLRDGFLLRGLRGATGTQASFLTLMDGDHDKVDELERRFLEKIGGTDSYAVTGQVYPRMFDSQVINALALAAEAAEKMCNDIRILSMLKEVEEPKEGGQIGSSAMAYKRNPMRCERTTALARFIRGLQVPVAATASAQFLERTLDDSAIRRLTLPEGFMAADGMLTLQTNIIRGAEVYPAVIDRHLREELPFIATEEILMQAVKAGGDRQELHEAIRVHSGTAAARVKLQGLDNNLAELLRADEKFSAVDINAMLDPVRHIGRAPEQVDRFLADQIRPVREKYADLLGKTAEVRV